MRLLGFEPPGISAYPAGGWWRLGYSLAFADGTTTTRKDTAGAVITTTTDIADLQGRSVSATGERELVANGGASVSRP